MIERYIDRLNVKMGSPWIGSYIWMNDSISGVIFKDVKMLSFFKIYPIIMMQFYKEGLIDIPKNDAKKMENYLNNTHLIKDDSDRLFVNGYYGKITNDDRLNISCYLCLMYNEILSKNKNIIYIDTDIIYYTGEEIDLFDIDLPHEIIKEIDYFVILNKKRYIKYNSKKCIFEEKGFGRNTTPFKYNVPIADKYISEIRTLIRNDKLEKILE